MGDKRAHVQTSSSGCWCGNRHRIEGDCPVTEWDGKSIVCCQDSRVEPGKLCAIHEGLTVLTMPEWSDLVAAEGVH